MLNPQENGWKIIRLYSINEYFDTLVQAVDAGMRATKDFPSKPEQVKSVANRSWLVKAIKKNMLFST
jgi:hypothetical protein